MSISGTLPVPISSKIPEGFRSRMVIVLTAFFMTLVALLRSTTYRVTRKLPYAPTNSNQNTPESTANSSKEDYRPPSPTQPFTETEVLSAVMKRLGELEEKVDTLQAKPSKMPFEKEELLNAAVCRVDALEAELIATKKVFTLTILSKNIEKAC